MHDTLSRIATIQHNAVSFADLDRSKLLTPCELVKRWEGSLYPVSNVTLSRWRRDSKGPNFIKIGAAGRVFYLLDSVLEFEQTNNIGVPING
jgi:hypothetical protein